VPGCIAGTSVRLQHTPGACSFPAFWTRPGIAAETDDVIKLKSPTQDIYSFIIFRLGPYSLLRNSKISLIKKVITQLWNFRYLLSPKAMLSAPSLVSLSVIEKSRCILNDPVSVSKVLLRWSPHQTISSGWKGRTLSPSISCLKAEAGARTESQSSFTANVWNILNV
jgi:hypothetical protein